MGVHLHEINDWDPLLGMVRLRRSGHLVRAQSPGPRSGVITGAIQIGIGSWFDGFSVPPCAFIMIATQDPLTFCGPLSLRHPGDPGHRARSQPADLVTNACVGWLLIAQGEFRLGVADGGRAISGRSRPFAHRRDPDQDQVFVRDARIGAPLVQVSRCPLDAPSSSLGMRYVQNEATIIFNGHVASLTAWIPRLDGRAAYTVEVIRLTDIADVQPDLYGSV